MKTHLILKSITVTNFRAVKDETLVIDEDITTIVGANESGKTSLLEAIELLDTEIEMQPSDTKINSTYSKKNVLPDVIFRFKASPELCKILVKYTKYFDKNSEFLIHRNDNDGLFATRLDGEEFPYMEAYKNFSDVEINVTTNTGQINLKPGDYTTALGVFVKNRKLIKDKKIGRIPKNEKDKLLSEELFETIEENLPRVFLWKYSDKYYIPKDVPIDFYNNRAEYESVINLFKLGGVSENEIASHLHPTNRDSVYKINFLENDVAPKVSRILNNTWKQRKNIKLKLHFKETLLEILVEEEGYQIDPRKRSEGLQWYLSFLINFRSKLSTLKNNIILFDQPGDKLHPGGQKDLLERFEELAEYNQIVYSTHTPFMISKQHPDRVRLITRPGDDTKIINTPSKKEIFKDELLRTSLGFVLSDIAPVAEKNILVEGLLDKVVLLEFIDKAKKFGFTMDINHSVFIPAHGASKILYYANFIKSNDLAVIALFDNDNAGREAIKQNKSKKVLQNNEIILVSSVNTSAETIEDLIPLNIIKDAANEIGKLSKTGYQFLATPKVPVMQNIIQHFTKEGIIFEDDIKFKISVSVIEKFRNLKITKADLNGNLKGLFDLVKLIKKKI